MKTLEYTFLTLFLSWTLILMLMNFVVLMLVVIVVMFDFSYVDSMMNLDSEICLFAIVDFAWIFGCLVLKAG